MQLIVAEKPSVAQDLAASLNGRFVRHEGYWESDEYLISWAVGHLLELAEPQDYDEALKRWSLESLPILPEEFRRKVRSGQKRQLQLLKKLARRKDVESLVNACDAAREGELIFREIEEFAGAGKPVFRLWLQSMTRDAIRDAFSRMEPAEKYAGLGAAAFCRAEADWLIGMNATRGITRRLKGRKEKGVWSAGRVQTPSLALLVHRELAVLAHVPRPYWRIQGSFHANALDYTGLYRTSRTGRDAEKIWEREQAESIRRACEGQPAAVVEKVTESRRKPPPLHSLTSLQKEANSRFGLSARRTLAAAQRLYEQHKVLTYPRTDSSALPGDYSAQVEELVAGIASGSLEGAFSDTSRLAGIEEAAAQVRDAGLKNRARNFDDAKVSDHFAIIPTGNWPATALGGDDAKVFELALRRFLAAFMGPSTWQKVVRTSTVRAAGGPFDFFTESNRLLEAGWQLVDRRPPASELLGDLGVAPGEPAQGRVTGLELEEDATRPPARYTEAGLLKAMESASDLDLDEHEDVDDEEALEALKSKGLGTPATRADTIEGLIAKGYVIRTGKSLRPTAKGITLIDFLQRIGADHLAKAELTAEMELHLYQVEQGQRQREGYMAEVAEEVRHLVASLQSFAYEDLYKDEPPLGKCPVDGAPLLEGLRGYRCSDPEHGWTLWKEFRGRYLNRPVAERLLKEGDTGPIEGFVNMRGQAYAGRIRFDADWKMVLEPVKDFKGSDDTGAVAPELVSYEVNATPLGPCPKCAKGQVVETPTHFVCRVDEEEKGCGLTMPRTVCKREMRREDLAGWLDPEEGRTDWFEDFTSRKGRPFTARLLRKENGRHGFEFKPRAPRKKKAAGKTARKVSRKKAVRKKAAKKASAKAATGE